VDLLIKIEKADFYVCVEVVQRTPATFEGGLCISPEIPEYLVVLYVHCGCGKFQMPSFVAEYIEEHHMDEVLDAYEQEL